MEKESRLPLLEQPLVKKAAALYAIVAEKFTKPREEVYLASSLIAFPENSLRLQKAATADINEKIREITLANIGGLLKKEFKEKKFDLPEHIPNFSEFDDFLFRMFCISGLPLDRIKRLERGILENNYGEKQTAGKFEYEKLLGIFKKVLGITEEPLNPVSAIVLLPDYPKDFLNRRMEIELARYLRIPLKEILFNNAHPRFRKDVVGKIVNPPLMEERDWKGKGEALAPNPPTIYIRNGPFLVLKNLDNGPTWKMKKAP